MTDAPLDIIRRHAQPLEPIPTGVSSKLRPLPDVRAVLFDVYGTLVISGSGDVGTVAAPPAAALSAACREFGLDVEPHANRCVELLRESIEEFHTEARSLGIEHPEVDIVAVWRLLLKKLRRRGWLADEQDRDAPGEDDPAPGELDVERLVIEYEMRANPVWEMPGARECLRWLAERAAPMGIVSNAQFFTLELFPALLGGTLPELGFSAELCVFSFRHGWAKPGTYLFQRALEALAQRDIAPGEVLYVGNDMRNDVMPARRLGMKTALFAGDDRSLRLRSGDQTVEDTEPDVIVTELRQILECLAASE